MAGANVEDIVALDLIAVSKQGRDSSQYVSGRGSSVNAGPSCDSPSPNAFEWGVGIISPHLCPSAHTHMKGLKLQICDQRTCEPDRLVRKFSSRTRVPSHSVGPTSDNGQE